MTENNDYKLFNKIKKLNITKSNLHNLHEEFNSICDMLNIYLENNRLIIGKTQFENNILLQDFFTKKKRNFLSSLSLKPAFKHTRQNKKINEKFINISNIYILAKKYEDYIIIVRQEDSEKLDITLNNKFILLLIKSVIYYYQYYYYIQKINDNPQLSSYDEFIDIVIAEYNDFISKVPAPKINKDGTVALFFYILL